MNYFLYQVAYDVTQENQDLHQGLWLKTDKKEKANALGQKVHDLLFLKFGGVPQMGSTFLVPDKNDLSAQELLDMILNYSDDNGEYFTDSERAHIKMSVADVNERYTDENRLATHNIEE